ncbi:MAG TPA: dihydrolipoyl dehydrogenase [bacterium]|nr:dihydrolipoyl dehydrogenase [bacterium]
MSGTEEYDVIIIGTGPGGYVAGIRASQSGLKACVIEKDKPGGVCLNTGCIPTKSLIHQAEVFLSCREFEEMGITVDTQGLDYRKIFEKSRKASETLSKGVQFLLKKNNVPLINGHAQIVSPHEVHVDDGTIIKGNNIVIATGSRPKELQGFEFDEEVILSSTDALFLEELPKKLIILGGGYIGCEFAFIMNAFGVEVIIVEMMEHILPMEDTETVSVLARSFRRKGITVMTNTRAIAIEKLSGIVSVTVEKNGGSRKVIEADKMLVVVGRLPNTEDIGLDNIGLKTKNGFISTGDYYQTAINGIFAIGDVIASPLLAHVASKEGEIAVEYIAGLKPVPQIDPSSIPSAVYTEPQIGSFGINENEAGENGIPYEKAVFSYRGNGKSVATGKVDGMIKVLYTPGTQEIIGAHVAGYNATELIHEILLAKTAGLKPENIAGMIHAHPTLSEVVMEVMRAVNGQAIHM